MCSNSGAIMPAENVPKKSATDNRRSNKPIMEKRRRARINNCLNELKNLILDAMKKDPARHSKLEKADILEMTVRHLQVLQRHQLALAVAADPSVVNKYRAGFAECANEVGRFISRLESVDQQVKQKLLSHLGTCLNGVAGVGGSSGGGSAGASMAPASAPSLHAQIPSAAAVNVLPPNSSEGNVFGGLQLVPTRLPNGDIAFVVPSQYLNGGSASAPQQQQHRHQQSAQPPPPSQPHQLVALPSSPTPLDKPLELTVPRPSVSLSPISSVGSMGSRTPSSLSPASSEVSELRMGSPGLARPIALVKSPRPESAGSSDERPWRPW